jgi:hypothetical protein
VSSIKESSLKPSMSWSAESLAIFSPLVFCGLWGRKR